MDEADELAQRRHVPPPPRHGDADPSQVQDLRERDVAERAVERAGAESDRQRAAHDRAEAAADRVAAARDRKDAADYLRRTYRDRLTGALQRDAGHEQLSGEVERARRDRTGLVLAFLDVVGLKATNDRLGHAAGDAVLRRVGQSLREDLRPYDVIVRWGGDEFVCGLPGTQLDAASLRFAQVVKSLATDGVGLSVGLAQLTPGEGLQDAVDRADRDLYARRRAEIRQ